MGSVPWHVKGVDRDAQETAREAARRSGLSVGEWLNSVIHDQAAAADVQNDPDPPSYRGDDYSTVNERLDDLSRQLDHIARNRQGTPPPLTGPLKYAPPNYREAQCGAEDAVAGLRKDLNEIGRILSEAMPRRAVEALEGEVRALAGRIDAGRQSGVDTAALAGLEQGL